ncbi:hypothetical protein [Haloterrigena alkaliphila]|uniref:Uncharacterized protein n=1 Tax=Haloterrigena alkaliphila TaxID=2816475 RepID=A0A8A2V9C6_9EURY|nr:hypothetical protein [Haloterrigena alkaliphila]QSW98543.1 hypothetical protein J0X25_14245 [Haloterrigena alkaliphila]
MTGTAGGDGRVRAVDPVTDAEDRATFVYDAPANVDASRDVEATLRFGDGAPRAVTYDIRVMDRDGGGTDGDGNSDSGPAPTATITDVSANTGGSQDRYDVSLEATDADGNLDEVEFELRNPDTGDVVDAATATLDGDRDAATERLRARGSQRLAEYRIVATVADADGQTGRDDATVAGSGS